MGVWKFLGDLLIIVGNLFVWTVIVRRMLPAKKLFHQGEQLTCFSRGKVFSRERLSFGTQGVFVYKGQTLQKQHAFAEIVALEKSSLSVNNAKIWRLLLKRGDQFAAYRFTPATGWKEGGFDLLHKHLQATQPHVVKSKWRKWMQGW